MELDITDFVNEYGEFMSDFSDSIANSGMQNIGQVTWGCAMDAMSSVDKLLTTDESALRDYFGESGAWDEQELADMTCQVLNAMLVQEIASDYRDRKRAKGRGTLAEYEENWGGRLIESERADGSVKWYYYIGM